jgi:hypothetical protein
MVYEKFCLYVVAHVCNSSTCENEVEGSEFEASLSNRVITSSEKKKNKNNTGHQWLTPAILATQEAKIRRTAI